MLKRLFYPLTFLTLLIPAMVYASPASSEGPLNLHLTHHPAGITALVLFIISYIFVMTEEFTHLRKSKPVVLIAGIIWAIIAWQTNTNGMAVKVEAALEHNLLEYAELFFFLLVAMTYVNAMEERGVFEKLKSWLINKGLSYRKLFWATGLLAFFISPIADNLTTALLMCAVCMAVGRDNPRFVGLSCINIVVAANAGGAFSPFGDITTLMVWQDGILSFFEFFDIFIPSLVSYLIPAAVMVLAIPNEQPKANDEIIKMRFGAKRIMLLFLATIATAVSFHNLFHLPPVIGMMTGLGYLNFFAYYIKVREKLAHPNSTKEYHAFDVFNKVKHAEWDTLFFFYGIILCVGGLATLGYLEHASTIMYHQWGANLEPHHNATPANIVVGFLSAIVDNIPVMYAVITMEPIMSKGQWLLVTLTAGIGGSILSIGSAAGVALMGQSKGVYTFFGHLKWAWIITVGYFAGIAVHIWMNSHLFHVAIAKVVEH